MKRYLAVLICSFFGLSMIAQPPARRKAQAEKKEAAKTAVSERAKLQFPVQLQMPADVAWRRDIYRMLDLTKDRNAALYYPVEPQNGQSNLFTYLFRLLLEGKISAYDYQLSGNETFAEADKLKLNEFLDRYHIYYQNKAGNISVDDSDIPSAEVLSYFIKESTYFDQHTSTSHTKVTAICPVLHRAGDFGGAAQKYPLFWLRYDDVSGLLAKGTLMTSNLNNAATMSMDDYFATNQYEGEIYKTTNMQGRQLADYCSDEKAMKEEQKKIESQIADFDKHLWSVPQAPADTVTTATVTDKKKESTKTVRSVRSSRVRTSSAAKTKAPKASKGGGGSAPRASVRRQRH